MSNAIFSIISDRLKDPSHGWSIGSFGAIGEFVRDADEPADVRETDTQIEVETARGAIRVFSDTAWTPIAWDSLSGDGESWGHTLAFCVPRPATPDPVLRIVGPDVDAIRERDRTATLIDCGVGAGAVSMLMRTEDPGLIAAVSAAEGQPMLTTPGLMAEVLRAQPNRILTSPAGRVEIFQGIPAPDGKSPEGPHTHLLSKLVPKDRCHSSNVPIPEGWQAALSLHPKSPWRNLMGEKHPFDAAADAGFAPLLTQYGLAEDAAVEMALIDDLDNGRDLIWPDTRRGRNKARIALRRLAAAGDERVKRWRALYDHAPIEIEEGEEA